MINTAIIPNGDIIQSPFMSHLNIMILRNSIQKHLHQNIFIKTCSSKHEPCHEVPARGVPLWAGIATRSAA